MDRTVPYWIWSACVLALWLGITASANNVDVKITTSPPSPQHRQPAELPGEPSPLGPVFRCYSPNSPDREPTSQDVAEVFDSSVTFRTDPRRMLLSNDIFFCEVPTQDELGRWHTRMYAVFGTVMVPRDDAPASLSTSPVNRAHEIDPGAAAAAAGVAQSEAEQRAKMHVDDPLLSFDEWKEQHLEHARKLRKSDKARERAAQKSQVSGSDARSFDKSAFLAASLSGSSSSPSATSTSEVARAPDREGDESTRAAHAESAAAAADVARGAAQAAYNQTMLDANAPMDQNAPADPGPPHIYAQEDASAGLAELKHRWNYASLDCAAILHKANPFAKSASAILSEKKDKYMLSPCPWSAGYQGDKSGRPESQFVIVELCQQIRVDTIVLSNLEFFSSMFKLFAVRVARSLHAPEDEWHTLGFFHARNARGYQVFKLSSAPQSYFRFLRIDFLEHYGTEFYCPVSLLRVYGRNEREDADDDMMDDINALDDDDVSDMLDDTVPSEPLLELASTHAIDGNRVVERACEREPFPGLWRPVCERVLPIVLPPPPLSMPTGLATNDSYSLMASQVPPPLDPFAPLLVDDMPTMCMSTSSVATTSSHDPVAGRPVSTSQPSSPPSSTVSTELSVEQQTTWTSATSTATAAAATSSSIMMPPPSSPRTTSTASLSEPPSPSTFPAPTSSSVTAVGGDLHTSSLLDGTSETRRTAEPKGNAAKPKSSNKPQGDTKSGGSESIYRTITKRLLALEANTSLSMQFLQLNSQKLRDKLLVLEQMQETRLAEMFAAMNASQARVWGDKVGQQQSALAALEAQQQSFEEERTLLLARIERLAADVRSEKRWGMAQLSLLLILLLILALTRSPTNLAHVAPHSGEYKSPPSLLHAPNSTEASPHPIDNMEYDSGEPLSAMSTPGRSSSFTLTPRPVASLQRARRRYATPSTLIRARRLRLNGAKYRRLPDTHTPHMMPDPAATEWTEKDSD